MAAPNGVRNFWRLTGRARPKTVILVGCGRGEEIPVMRQLFRRPRIIGVEPLGEHWRFMRKFDQLPDVKLQRALYHAADSSVLFHLNYEPDQRATIYDLPVSLDNEITRRVPTITLDQIAAAYGPFRDTLLWVDIEGAEYEALQDCQLLRAADNGIRWVNLELNFCPPRQTPPWARVNRLMEGYGYQLVAMHSVSRNCRQADGLYIPRADWESLRVRIAEEGKKRKLERLAKGRGRTAQTYQFPEEEHHGDDPSDGGHTGPSEQQAAAG